MALNTITNGICDPIIDNLDQVCQMTRGGLKLNLYVANLGQIASTATGTPKEVDAITSEVGKEIEDSLKDLATIEIINSKIGNKNNIGLANMYYHHYTKLLDLLDASIPKDGHMIEGLIGLHILSLSCQLGIINKDNLEVKDDLEIKDNLETVETVESMENIKKDSFELNKGEKMTLEELSEKMMDDWRDGVYTKAYNDYDALLSGREMRDIFIEEAKKKADVVEPGEIQSYADYFEEAIEEGIANLR